MNMYIFIYHQPSRNVSYHQFSRNLPNSIFLRVAIEVCLF